MARFTVEPPEIASAWRLHNASRSTLGVSATGLLITPDPEELWEADELVGDEDDELIAGPEHARERLRDRLGELHPGLLNKLDGAWERVGRNGPDAASQAANSLVELLDWTLRLVAPDVDVMAWHTAEARSAKELHEGRPTRSLRVLFAVRARPDAAAAEMYVKAVRPLMELLQGQKHGAAQQQVAAIARLVPTVEAILSFVLL